MKKRRAMCLQIIWVVSAVVLAIIFCVGLINRTASSEDTLILQGMTALVAIIGAAGYIAYFASPGKDSPDENRDKNKYE